MINISEALQAKATDINSYSMVSPTGRVSTKDKTVLNITVYFIGKPNKDGKPTKAATQVWTPNGLDAAKLKIDVGTMPDTVKIGDTTYRFLHSDLTPEDMKELKDAKGMQKANRIIKEMKAMCKGINSGYVMQLSADNRKKLTDKLSVMLDGSLDILMRNVDDEDEEESLF